MTMSHTLFAFIEGIPFLFAVDSCDGGFFKQLFIFVWNIACNILIYLLFGYLILNLSIKFYVFYDKNKWSMTHIFLRLYTLKGLKEK